MAAAMIMATATMQAQKNFTLDDLLSGGSTFWQLQPENRYTQWWGNTAIETTPEAVKDLLTGDTLFTVEQLNTWAGDKVVHSGHNLSFPYPAESLVLCRTPQKRVLIDFQKHVSAWSQSMPAEAKNQDWNPLSRNLAFTIQGNLYIVTSSGEQRQLTTDGSTDGSENIVYGQSVRRIICPSLSSDMEPMSRVFMT